MSNIVDGRVPKPLVYREAVRVGSAQIGGKAWSVAKLAELGIRVPEGCVLPADMWELIQNSPDPVIASRQAAATIVSTLSARRYVVRSSAVGEDSATGSWAGCFESVINVPREQLGEAILTCGNSLYSRRVRMYRTLRPQLAPVNRIGILVQEYIYSTWNGVCFSADPLTGDCDRMAIEYLENAAGAVVQGSGIPKTITVQKGRPVSCAGTSIPEVRLKELVDTVTQIERCWKTPVDVEWLITPECLYIVQARPITTI